MTKTNHQRGFKAVNEKSGKWKRKLRCIGGIGLGAELKLPDDSVKIVAPKYMGVIHDRGNRRNIAGAKKFVHSRTRAAFKQALTRTDLNTEQL